MLRLDSNVRLAALAALFFAAFVFPSSAAGAGGVIMTVAGGGVGDGGPATGARLYGPSDVAVDGADNLYVLDTKDCRVRMVSGGTISTVVGGGSCGYGGDGGTATSASLSNPEGIALDGAGNLYIADTYNCIVRKVSSGIITRVAGNYGWCSDNRGDGGWATGASLLFPSGVSVDIAGDLYIIAGCVVRKVSAGIISTVAGDGTCTYGGDGGPATSASLYFPKSMAFDGAGNLYIADKLNCRVRKVSGGIISTVAGNGACAYGGDGGPATSASLLPSGVALDSTGDLYIAGDCRVRKVSGGVISTVAGNGTCTYSGDGGQAISAGLASSGVAVDGAGNLYIADQVNCRVREVSGGTISTVAGRGSCSDIGDGGPATGASLLSPWDVALDDAGSIYIADSQGCRVRKVSGGTISTVAGNGTCAYGGDGGPATSASLSSPAGVALDSAGNLYIVGYLSCRVRKVSGGMISTVAGDGTCTYSGDGGPATSAGLAYPFDVAVNVAGDLYIADNLGCRVRKVSGGMISTVAGNGICTYGGDGGPATAANLKPVAVALDVAGDLYIAGNCRVRKVSGGTISTVAGTGSCGYGGDGGPATAASIVPSGVAVDGVGDLYLAEDQSCRVRKVSGGVISTAVGTGSCGFSGDGGPATAARLNGPSSVALDGGGNLYISDAGNGRIRATFSGVGGVAEPPNVGMLRAASPKREGDGWRPWAIAAVFVVAIAIAWNLVRRRRRADGALE